MDPEIARLPDRLVDSTVEPPNPKGIPTAIFIEAVEEFVGPLDPAIVLKCLHELHGKYQYLQQSFMQSRAATTQKLPDIRSAAAAIKHIQKKKDADENVDAHFQLSDNVYVKADIPPGDKVALWLGANVMLEYSTDEAATLLAKNENNAILALEENEAALQCLRDQITTTEVNIARVHNLNVKRRADERAAEAASAPAAPDATASGYPAA